MSNYRSQEKLRGDICPIIVNVMNFAKAPPGEATLLTFDDARTLFHEFGHALHGMLSNVTYPMISGTSVARDFVELPSQLFEHWLSEKDVLSRFAVHYKTGATIPDDLIDRCETLIECLGRLEPLEGLLDLREIARKEAIPKRVQLHMPLLAGR